MKSKKSNKEQQVSEDKVKKVAEPLEHLEKSVKKTYLRGKNAYHYHRIQDAKYYFIPCVVEEGKEELNITYEIKGMSPLEEGKTQSKRMKYLLLTQVAQLREARDEFSFSLAPSNLYFNQQGRVRVLERDIVLGDEKDAGETDAKFLKEFKALIAFLMQKKFGYKDFIEGGESLYNQQDGTKFLTPLNTLTDLEHEITKRYEETVYFEQTKMRLVDKAKYQVKQIALVLAIVATLASIGFFVYQKITVIDPQQKALNAERAFLETEYVKVIDSLKGIELEDMDVHEKYILAVAYIRGQSVDAFDDKAKEMILSKISYNGDVEIMDYWISLGRLDVDRAIDIALKQANDQLLLYGYLQKLNQVSDDTSLSGEEKSTEISSLEDKIKKTADKLSITYQETQENLQPEDETETGNEGKATEKKEKGSDIDLLAPTDTSKETEK